MNLHKDFNNVAIASLCRAGVEENLMGDALKIFAKHLEQAMNKEPPTPDSKLTPKQAHLWIKKVIRNLVESVTRSTIEELRINKLESN